METVSHSATLEFLSQAGLKVNPNFRIFADIDGVIAYCESWAEKRLDLPYDIDGLVIKLNSIAGQTRWAVPPRTRAGPSLSNFPPNRL